MKRQFDDTITALDYHKKVGMFAVATGYDWKEKIHELDRVNQMPQILVFKVFFHTFFIIRPVIEAIPDSH